MADISKVKMPDGKGGVATYNVKDAQARTDVATAQGAIAAEVTRATEAEGTLTTNLAAEVTRATGVESGLDTRIQNLEARGRFLSGYTVATGLPTTYPTVPSGQTSYTYTFKSGDYYIVESVPASGKKYMPDGASISTTDGGTTWTVGKKETALEIGVGDYFTYDGTKWIHISNSQKTVSFSQIAGNATDNTSLNTELGKKLDKATATVAGVAFDASQDVPTEDLQEALGLEDLAYSTTASGSYTPAGTIAALDVTPAGSVTLNDLTQTSTSATISTKADYTPAGTVKIDNAAQATGNKALKGGSITVELQDVAASATNFTYGSYTPAGTVSLTASATGSFQVAGTNAASDVTITPSTDTFVKSLKAGNTDAATLTKGSAVVAATEGVVATVGTGDDAETLIFTAASTDNVMDYDASLSSEKIPVVDATTTAWTGYTAASAAAQTFTGSKFAPSFSGTADNIKATAVAYNEQSVKTATFNPVEADITFTGTTSSQLIPTEIKYDKATANGASFSGTSKSVTPVFSGTAATIEVTPD